MDIFKKMMEAHDNVTNLEKSLAVLELKNRLREKIKTLGHQQDDDTIWCNMDEILSLPELTP